MDQRHLVGAAVRHLAIQRIKAGVQHAIGKPAAIDALGRIEDGFREFDPVDLARRLPPKCLGIAHRPRINLVVAAGGRHDIFSPGRPGACSCGPYWRWTCSPFGTSLSWDCMPVQAETTATRHLAPSPSLGSYPAECSSMRQHNGWI